MDLTANEDLLYLYCYSIIPVLRANTRFLFFPPNALSLVFWIAFND